MILFINRLCLKPTPAKVTILITIVTTTIAITIVNTIISILEYSVMPMNHCCYIDMDYTPHPLSRPLHFRIHIAIITIDYYSIALHSHFVPGHRAKLTS